MKYCLTKDAKEQLTLLVSAILAIIGLLLLVFTLICMVIVADYLNGTFNGHVEFAYYGIIAWLMLFSYTLIAIHKWLRKSIVGC